MINLLPYENQKQVRAARANVILIKCLAFLSFAVLFLSLACTASYLFLKNAQTASSSTAANTASANNKAAATMEQVTSAKSELTAAKNILEQQVSYSKIITEVASSLPSGVILETLSVNSATLNTPVSMTLRATSAEKAQDIKTSFGKSRTFSGLNIKTVSPITNGSSDYPYTIMITVVINRGSEL